MPCKGHVPFMFLRVQISGLNHVAEIAQALDSIAGLPCPPEHRKQNCDQQSDDADHHEQFDQRESAICCTTLRHKSLLLSCRGRSDRPSSAFSFSLKLPLAKHAS